jgi:hypothetical protein
MKSKASILKIGILIMTLVISIDTSAQNSGDEIIRQERATGEFKGVSVSNGIELYLTQSDKTSVGVETYSDKQDVVKTEVKNGILKIFIDGKYNRKTGVKVFISNPIFEQISGSSAASVKCETTVKGEKIYLDFSSAASLSGTFEGREINCELSSAASAKFSVTTSDLYVKISSASEAEVRGTTDKLLLDAQSASEFDAFELTVKKCTASVSSGADVDIFVDEELIGEASSGSQINFKGNASSELCNTSSGAEIRHLK